jgi:hypothetical protein
MHKTPNTPVPSPSMLPLSSTLRSKPLLLPRVASRPGALVASGKSKTFLPPSFDAKQQQDRQLGMHRHQHTFKTHTFAFFAGAGAGSGAADVSGSVVDGSGTGTDTCNTDRKLNNTLINTHKTQHKLTGAAAGVTAGSADG